MNLKLAGALVTAGIDTDAVLTAGGTMTLVLGDGGQVTWERPESPASDDAWAWFHLGPDGRLVQQGCEEDSRDLAAVAARISATGR